MGACGRPAVSSAQRVGSGSGDPSSATRPGGASKEDVVRSPSQPVAEEGAVLHVSALPPRSWGHAASAAARDEVMESVGSEG